MSSHMAPEDDLVVEIDVDELELVRALAAESGVEVVELHESGFVAEAALLSVMLVGATAMFRRALEERRGGQVIDLRPGAPRERYRDPGLRFDIIEIRGADGTVEVKVAAPHDTLSEVLAALRDITVEVASAGVEAAVTAASAAVGGRAVVHARTTSP